MNYLGVPCPVCGKEFTENDDIVVCPECGAPYHRECYKKEGRCVMDDLHREHRDWENPNDLKARSVARETIVVCPACGQPNPAGSTECEQCGQALRSPIPEEAPYGEPVVPPGSAAGSREHAFAALFEQIDLSGTIEGIPIQEVMAFVQNNFTYFVRLFKVLSTRVTSSIFNWSAFLFGPLYFIYRKMYRPGFLILTAWLAVQIPSFVLAYNMAPQVIANPALLQTLAFDMTGYETLVSIVTLCSYVPFLLHIFCGFTANRKYYQFAIGSLQQIRQDMPGASREELVKVITRRGGINPVGTFLVTIGVTLALFLVCLIMALKLMPPV